MILTLSKLCNKDIPRFCERATAMAIPILFIKCHLASGLALAFVFKYWIVPKTMWTACFVRDGAANTSLADIRDLARRIIYCDDRSERRTALSVGDILHFAKKFVDTSGHAAFAIARRMHAGPTIERIDFKSSVIGNSQFPRALRIRFRFEGRVLRESRSCFLNLCASVHIIKREKREW